jgi:putative hemolysin
LASFFKELLLDNKMKKQRLIVAGIILIILLILFTIIFYIIKSSDKSQGIKDPAAEYCINSGYDYQIETRPDGSQYGTCTFSDDSKCNAWDFFCKCVNDKRYCSTQNLNCSQECN